MQTRKIPDEWKHKVKKGFPIRSKWIKGYEYAYQRLAAGRDPETGKVHVTDRHLGAWTPARPKPLIDQLTAADHNRVAKAWRDGEDMDLIIARIETCTGHRPAPATVYNFMRAHGIARAHQTARAAKRSAEVVARIEQVRRQKAEEKKRKEKQAEIRDVFRAQRRKENPPKRKPFSEKAKRNMSEASKGKPKSKEHIQRMSAGHQGIAYDEWCEFAKEKKYCPKFTELCRESNREKYGRRCFICNKTEKANGQKLSVHHVDMDRAQGCESNWKLVPLCRHCHATAHNDEIVARLGYILKK